MKNLVLVFLGAGWLSVAGVGRAATNQLTSLLQQGLFEEEANRNPDAAIVQYQSLAARFDEDRQVAATAVFRLGECYRKLGRTNEAAAQYERVLRDFGDQSALTTLSRQNLAALGARVSAPMSPPPGPDQVKAAAAAEIEAATLKAQLDQLLKLDGIELRAALQQQYPDPVLTKLLQDLAEAQQKLVLLRKSYSPEHEVYQNGQMLVERIEKQIDDEIAGTLKGLQVKLNMLVETAGNLRKTGSVASSEDQVSDLAEQQEIRRCEAMLQNSPDLINAAHGEEGTPLYQAASRGQLRVASYLLDHGAGINLPSGAPGKIWSTWTPLIGAVAGGHKAMVELLLSRGADINAATDEGCALNIAADRNFQSVVETLLKHKADPNSRDHSRNTPLHRAVNRSAPALVELLLRYGADVNAQDDLGRTPLHQAASAGSAEIVSLLLANRADVNIPDNSGERALHRAAKANQAAVIKLLREKGADVNAQKTYGETALLQAVDANAVEAVNALLQAKADPNLVNTTLYRSGWGPLHISAQHGNAPITDALLQHGANPNLVTSRHAAGLEETAGSSPLFMALDANKANLVVKHPEVVSLLLRCKANPNLTNANGLRPLSFAIKECQSAPIVKALLEAGADVNAPVSREGWLPLQLAVSLTKKELIETILAFHPEVNARGYHGITALDQAKQHPDVPPDIIALLRANGALDEVPYWDRINVVRPSSSYSSGIFWKGTNDWNRFSLLELIATEYHRIETRYDQSILPRFAGPINNDPLRFPDLKHVVIHRPAPDSRSWKSIPVNVEAIQESGDCAPDVWLEWGDSVEIPEADHPLETQWTGFDDQRLFKCVSRKVHVTVQGKTTYIELAPAPFNPPSFMLLPVLNSSRLLRFSSDLSRVKVTREDAQTRKKQEWILDCSGANPAAFWVRDGDTIDVPEKP